MAATDLPCSCFLVANAVNLAQSLDIQMQHLPGLFPTGNAGWALFPPKMKSGSSRVYARPGTRCCGKGQDVTQFHHQSGALCAKPKWNQNLVPSVCPGIASGENFCPQDSQSLPACSGSSTFWRYAGLHQKPAATAAAGFSLIRRIISSRPRAVNLAFLWLFTLSSARFTVVCQLQLYRLEAG